MECKLLEWSRQLTTYLVRMLCYTLNPVSSTPYIQSTKRHFHVLITIAADPGGKLNPISKTEAK